MHFHAERLTPNTFAMSHTYVQEGDLMRDPEIVFLRQGPGLFVALECTQDPMGAYTQCVELDAFEQITGFRPRALKGVTQLANMWAGNLRAQFPEIAAMAKAAAKAG